MLGFFYIFFFNYKIFFNLADMDRIIDNIFIALFMFIYIGLMTGFLKLF